MKSGVNMNSYNPFCMNCKEAHCLISGDNTCEMIRIYLKAKKQENISDNNFFKEGVNMSSRPDPVLFFDGRIWSDAYRHFDAFKRNPVACRDKINFSSRKRWIYTPWELYFELNLEEWTYNFD